MNLFVKDVTNVEKLTIMQSVNQLPFLWAEASGTSYFAELCFPVENVTEALEYIEQTIAPVREKAEFFMMDLTNALTFTIDYKLFNQESKQWTFNLNEVTERFQNLIVKIREGVS
jgi:methyl-accepting chemotaxis protein